MKKVLVLASTFPRWKHDSRPAFVYNICRHVKKYKMIVLAPHHLGARKKENMDDVTVYRFPYFPEKYQTLASGAGLLTNAKSLSGKAQVPFFFSFMSLNLLRVIKKENPDVIHAYWVIPCGIVAAMLTKKPLVITSLGSDVFALHNAMFRKMQKKAYKDAKKVLVLSNALKNEIAHRFPQIEKKIVIMPLGIDSGFKPGGFAKDLRDKHKGRIILTIGRLTEQKGVQYLISALPSIIQQHPDARLVIVGDGSYKKELESMIKKHKVKDYVTFVGPVAHENIADYLSVADVFVFPSLSDSRLGTEGFGLAAVEALAVGTPTVATNIGGIVDIIKDKETGLLVSQKNSKAIAEKVNLILSDDALRQKLSIQGKRHVKKNFTWESIARRLERVYDQVLR